MDHQKFLQFLYMSESDSVDFKRDQYKISNATDDDKSEFIKDILAMTNSWRKTEAYILLGIKDKSEKPNDIFGINEHVDDAVFQQLINSKTNKPCIFNYETHTFQNKTFGLFRIPVQSRPIFLKKDFGKLKANIVYVRRGSATFNAGIDEISQMGQPIIDDPKLPKLKLSFFNPESEVKHEEIIKYTLKPFSILDSIPELKGDYSILPSSNINKKYYKELFDYYNFQYRFAKINFLLENVGNSEGKNIEINIEILESNFEICQEGDEPQEPFEDDLLSQTRISDYPPESDLTIKRKNNKISIISLVESLHSKNNIELEGTIYIDPQFSREIDLYCKIFCDKIEKPFEQLLKIQFIHSMEKIIWADFLDKMTSK